MGLIRLYVFVSLCFMLLCYFDQTIYCLFCLVPVHSHVWINLEARFKSSLKIFLKDIGIHTVW